MEDDRLRADVALVAAGLCSSRERARAAIAAGLAYADGIGIRKPAQQVAGNACLELRGEACPYVSRGGWKLEKALQAFHIDARGQCAIDIGASTGGFTDVLLRAGVRKVYAVDVGTAQLDARIAADPRVIPMERVNARTLTRDMFPEAPTLGTVDVSFISVQKILPALREVMGTDGRLVVLVKPQFEAGHATPGKRGVVSSPTVHERVLRELCAAAPGLGWRVRTLESSPIRGGDGNIEFLADLLPETSRIPSPTPEEIKALVQRAHREAKASPFH